MMANKKQNVSHDIEDEVNNLGIIVFIKQFMSLLTDLKDFFLNPELIDLSDATVFTKAEVEKITDELGPIGSQLIKHLHRFSRSGKYNANELPIESTLVKINFNKTKKKLIVLQELITDTNEKFLMESLVQYLFPFYDTLFSFTHLLEVMKHVPSIESETSYCISLLKKQVKKLKEIVVINIFQIAPINTAHEVLLREEKDDIDKAGNDASILAILPPELICNVLSFLTDINDITSGLMVCKAFNLALTSVMNVFHRNQLKLYFPHVAARLAKHHFQWWRILDEIDRYEYMHLNEATRGLLQLVKVGNLEAIKAYEFDLTDLFSIDINGWCALDWAKKQNHQAILDFFFQQVIEKYFPGELLDLEKADIRGNNLLHWGVWCRQPASKIQELIAEGADIHARDNEENTAFMIAVRTGQLETVKTLLAAGADSRDEGMWDYTTFIVAATAEYVEVAKFLLEKDEYPNGDDPLMNCVFLGNIRGVEAFVKAGSDIEARDEYGMNMLMIAIHELNSMRTGYSDYVVSIPYIQKLKIVQYLIEQGADINCPNDEEETPLLLAIREGLFDVVHLLLAAGVKVAPATVSVLASLGFEVPEAILRGDTNHLTESSTFPTETNTISNALDSFLQSFRDGEADNSSSSSVDGSIGLITQANPSVSVAQTSSLFFHQVTRQQNSNNGNATTQSSEQEYLEDSKRSGPKNT